MYVCHADRDFVPAAEKYIFVAVFGCRLGVPSHY
jgi:hypothetical protein